MKKWGRMCKIWNIHAESQCHFLKNVNYFVNMRCLTAYIITLIYMGLNVTFVEGNSSLIIEDIIIL